jgi:hypothetical protein
VTEPLQWQVVHNPDGSLTIRLASARRLAEIRRLASVLLFVSGLILVYVFNPQWFWANWASRIGVVGVTLFVFPRVTGLLLFEISGTETIEVSQASIRVIRQLFWYRQVKVYPASKVGRFEIYTDRYSRSIILFRCGEQSGRMASRVNEDVAQSVLAIVQERFPGHSGDEEDEEDEFDFVAGIAALVSISAPILLVLVPIGLLILGLVFGWWR